MQGPDVAPAMLKLLQAIQDTCEQAGKRILQEVILENRIDAASWICPDHQSYAMLHARKFTGALAEQESQALVRTGNS